MCALTTLGYCCRNLVQIKLYNGILLLISTLLLYSPTDLIAQNICNPKILTSATNSHSDGIACSGNGNVEIILEDGTEISTTAPTTPGIVTSNSGEVSISGSNTSIITANDHSNGISILGGQDIIDIAIKNIEIKGNGGFGILATPDGASSTTIEVNNVTLSGTNGLDENGLPIAGIKFEATGDVDITSTGKISTEAPGVQGILVFLQSGTTEKTVNIKVNDLETQGNTANGIYVFSKNVDSTKQTETIEIDVLGKLMVAGENSQGIVVESTRSNIMLTIGPEGRISTGDYGPQVYALFLAGVENSGENNTAQIDNLGLVSGNIFTEGCAVYRNNGTTITQNSVTISSTNCQDSGFYNSGSVDIGGKDEYKTTALTGNYIQEENGQLLIDIDWSKNDSIDLLTITGSANLNGQLVVNSLNLPDLSGFEFKRGEDFKGKVINSRTFLTATDGITGNLQYDKGSTLLLVNKLTKSSNNNELALTLAFGDGLSLLNRNQTNVFWGMNSARTKNDQISDVFSDLFTKVNLAELQKILDSHGNEIAGATIRSEYRNIEQFGPPMDYCENNPIENTDETSQVTTTDCKFFTAKILIGSHSGNFEQREHEDKMFEGLFRIPLFETSGVGQFQLLGKINKSQLELTDFATSDGHSGTLGLGYFEESNIGTLSFLVQAGLGSYKITRKLVVLDKLLTSRGTLKSRFAGISAQISNSFDLGSGALNWYLQAGYHGINSKPYTETGGEDFALVVDKTSSRTFVINPRLKYIGQTMNLGYLDIVPLVGVGITHRSNPEVAFKSEFSAGGDKILSTTVLPETEFNYFIGTDLSRADNKLNGRLGYSGYVTDGESLSGEILSGQLTFLF